MACRPLWGQPRLPPWAFVRAESVLYLGSEHVLERMDFGGQCRGQAGSTGTVPPHLAFPHVLRITLRSLCLQATPATSCTVPPCLDPRFLITCASPLQALCWLSSSSTLWSTESSPPPTASWPPQATATSSVSASSAPQPEPPSKTLSGTSRRQCGWSRPGRGKSWLQQRPPRTRDHWTQRERTQNQINVHRSASYCEGLSRQGCRG